MRPQVSVADLIRKHEQHIQHATPPPKPVSVGAKPSPLPIPNTQASSPVAQVAVSQLAVPSTLPKAVPASPSPTALADADVFTKGGKSYYTEYSGEVSFRLKQSVYLDNKDPAVKAGVCRAASMHWLDRGLRGKESLASSKHGAVASSDTQAPWTARMDDKFTKQWVPVQKVDDPVANAAHFGLKLGKSQEIVSTPYIDSVMHGPGLYQKGAKGEVLHDGPAMADRIAENVAPGKSYLLTLQGSALNKGDPDPVHVVALRAGPEAKGLPGVPSTVRLFDPNIGELSFDTSTAHGQARLGAFLSDWSQSDLSRSQRGPNTYYGLGVQKVFMTEVERA